MIRSALVGLYVCAVTVGAVWAGTQWPLGSADSKTADEGKKYQGKLAHVKLKPMSVPVVSDGKVAGYIVTTLSYTAPAEALKPLSVKPDVFLADAVLAGIYTGRALDIKKLDRESWGGLAATVKEAVNARYGSAILHDVVLEEFGYVPLDTVRGGPLKAGERSTGVGKKVTAAGH